jgi:hypothetical protein
VGGAVESRQFLRSAAGELLDLCERLLHGRAQGFGQYERAGLGEVPEQLGQLPHHREHRRHRAGRLRVGAPVAAGDGVLGDPLPGAEAVEDDAAGEAPVVQLVVDAAAAVGEQVRRPESRAGQCRQTQPRSVAPAAAVARQNRAPMGSCSASGCGQAGQPGSCAGPSSGSRFSEVSVECAVYVGTVMAAA